MNPVIPRVERVEIHSAQPAEPNWKLPLLAQADLNGRIKPLNDAEIALLMKRGRHFQASGMPSRFAAAWADRLALRDQEADDRTFCMECVCMKRDRCIANQIFSRDALLRCDQFQVREYA
jgi:hypothetical protein